MLAGLAHRLPVIMGQAGLLDSSGLPVSDPQLPAVA